MRPEIAAYLPPITENRPSIVALPRNIPARIPLDIPGITRGSLLAVGGLAGYLAFMWARGAVVWGIRTFKEALSEVTH